MSYELSRALTAAYARIADLEAKVVELEEKARLAEEAAQDWRSFSAENATKAKRLAIEVDLLTNDRDHWRSAHAAAVKRGR